MKKWRCWLGLIFVLAVILGLWFDPVSYWSIIGWLRGDATYKGWPTSYWRAEIRSRYEDSSRPSEAGSWRALLGIPHARPPDLEELFPRFGSINKDPATLPVLLALLKDTDHGKYCAAAVLPYFDPPIPDAVPVLIEELKNENSSIVVCALGRLERYGPQAAPAVPTVLALMRSKEWCRRQGTVAPGGFMNQAKNVILGPRARAFLERVDPNAAQIASVLLEEK